MSSYDIKRYLTGSALFKSYMEFLYLRKNGLETIFLSLSFLCFFSFNANERNIHKTIKAVTWLSTASLRHRYKSYDEDKRCFARYYTFVTY